MGIYNKRNTDCNTFKTLEFVDEKQKFVATFGMQWLRGNSQPYFSITGDFFEFGCWSCCGSAHKEISELLPKLEPLIKWHLCDQNGEPMHYIANAVYWKDCYLGKYPKCPFDPEPVTTFANHIVYGACAGDTDKTPEEWLTSENLVEWLESRKAPLQAAFLATMSEFEIELIPTF